MKNSANSSASDQDQVRVTIGEKGYQASIKAGEHELLADEPTAMGGTNTGPKPEELLLSALGACTVITLRMYADRKAWPLTKVESVVVFRAEEEQNQHGNFPLRNEVWLHGNLAEDQVRRLAEIAVKCPMHKRLSPAFEIRTEVALAAPEFQ